MVLVDFDNAHMDGKKIKDLIEGAGFDVTD